MQYKAGSVFRRFFGNPHSFGKSSQTRRGKRANVRLMVEQLETRLTPSANIGTVHLTDVNGTIVEETHYATKPDVYVYGNGLTDGYYDMAVIAPGGRAAADDISTGVVLGWELTGNVHVTNGNFDGLANLGGAGPYSHQISQPISVYYNVSSASSGFTTVGFDDTTNNGGEYQVVLARHQNAAGVADNAFPTNDVAKSKNFKVEQQFTSLGTSISTSYTLSPSGATGSDTTAPGTVFAPFGSTATDTATVIDENGAPVTEGSVTFHFYNADNGMEIGTGVTVALDGVHNTVTDTTIEGPLGVGDYYFTASYTDGQTYDSSDSGQEPFTIQGSNHHGLTFDTTIHYAPGPNGAVIADNSEVPLGTSVYDSSTITGSSGIPVTGMVTYELFKVGSPTDTSLGTFGSPTISTVDGSVADSSASGGLGAGSYYWVAHFSSTSQYYVSGDSDHEPFTIDPGTVSLSTTLLASGSVTTSTGTVVDGGVIANNSDLAYGSSIKDSVTATGVAGFPPQGTVTFTFYRSNVADPGDTESLGTLNATLGTSVAMSLAKMGLTSGDYYFTCSYNGGDPNYVSSGLSDHEPFHINVKPSVIPHTYDCVNVGSTYSAPNNYGPGVLGGATDPDGPNALTAVLCTGPSHNAAAPVFVLNSDGSFSYTPDPTWVAAQPTGSHPTDSFTYKAFDGLDYSNVATATLKINRAPVAVADSISTQMNVPKTGNVLTNDRDPDGDTLVVCAVNGSAANVGVTVNLGSGSTLVLNANGSFTYTPGPDFHGTQSFSYTVCDPCGLKSTAVTDTFTVTSNARTQGYWKTHETSTSTGGYWTLDNGTKIYSITVAGVSYTANEAVAIMNLSTSNNAISMLFQQLVAAKINVLNGVTPDAADQSAISDADYRIDLAAQQILGTSYSNAGYRKITVKNGGAVYSNPGSTAATIAVSSTLGQYMVVDNNILTAFNQTGT
jgi:VCBS repeat-containing protein